VLPCGVNEGYMVRVTVQGNLFVGGMCYLAC